MIKAKSSLNLATLLATHGLRFDLKRDIFVFKCFEYKMYLSIRNDATILEKCANPKPINNLSIDSALLHSLLHQSQTMPKQCPNFAPNYA